MQIDNVNSCLCTVDYYLCSIVDECRVVVHHPVAGDGSIVVVWLYPLKSEAAGSDVECRHILRLFRAVCEIDRSSYNIICTRNMEYVDLK